MSIKSPSMIARWHPINQEDLGSHRPPPASATSKLAVWILLLLGSHPPQAAGW
jgi:hypothetical protein